ncbi:MAG TPA: PAC2 family protein [Acidimicrobiales bacterium]|nr:PAC2 family protein [Acidimicrobiales bacterium]
MTSVARVELLRWDAHPQLRRPALVAAFEGWNDAGNAASETVAYLSRAWGASRFAAFDAEELWDFTSSRPQVRLESGRTRRLEWPEVQLASAPLPGQDRDVVFVSGPEPQLRWRSFAREVRGAAESLGVRTAVLVGALLADVPHTRPVRISGGAATDELADLAGVEPSYYEGPTGIVGVVSDALGQAGIPTVSLWASVPHYVSQSASPKATLALVEKAVRILGSTVDVVELEISAAAYERQINELVASDDDASAYVTRLEEQDSEADAGGQMGAEDGPKLGPASGEHLAAEVERYLRDHRRD